MYAVAKASTSTLELRSPSTIFAIAWVSGLLDVTEPVYWTVSMKTFISPWTVAQKYEKEKQNNKERKNKAM